MALIVAAVLFTGHLLDGLSFAAVHSLPGLIDAEVNPITAWLYRTGGLPLFLVVKIGLPALAATMIVWRPPARALTRLLVAIVLVEGYVGAAGNIWALDQLLQAARSG